ncbi:MAG: DUF4347 domain-containing protein [Planctomycetes bacterium]|nr:DUF4347 domain-containing protein [Planctomycetota bacterium]
MTLGLRVLEERVLFDAAPVEEIPENEPRESASQPESAPPAHEVVFIDGHLSDAQGLASAAIPGAEVHVLDPSIDGLDQILDILSGRSGISAIHVLSHGDEGAVEIGSTVLDSSALGARAEDLALLGRALSQDGDLLLYGCQVGTNGEGARFAASLATLTGADVALSTDDTGGSALGGDWELERSTGPIEARLPIDSGALDRYEGLLALTSQGGEFTVNNTTANGQESPAVAVNNTNGNFVVAWWSDEGAGSYDIRARLFDASGNPLGADFVVNTTTPNNQNRPAIAMDRAGNFVVVYDSDEGGYAFDIRARRFDSGGNPLGPDFVVNSTVGSADVIPSVAVDGSGNFVVAWMQDTGLGYDIAARRFDSAGNPIGADFAVNSTNANWQLWPSVAATPGGGFVAAWQSNDSGVDYDIRARRFDSAGNALGTDFVVNNTTANSQVDPDVAVDRSGSFVIAWRSDVAFDYDIRARRFDSAGNPLGADFVVNSTTTAFEWSPAVAVNGTGTTVFAWQSFEVGGWNIRAREFDASGNPAADDFLVNPTTAGPQIQPDIAYGDNGQIVVTWVSNQAGTWDIFARRFLGPAVPRAAAAAEPPFDPVNILDILGARTPHLQPGAPTDPGFPSWDFRLELARSPGADLSDLDPGSSTLLRELFEATVPWKRRLRFPGI